MTQALMPNPAAVSSRTRPMAGVPEKKSMAAISQHIQAVLSVFTVDFS